MGVVKMSAWPSLRGGLVAVLLSVVAGCSSLSGGDAKVISDETRDGVVRHSFSDAAVVSAWQRAEVARQGGDFMGAFRELRRALEIDPADPVVWSRLAEIAMRLNKLEPAEKYAERSNQLADGNTTLIYRNWLIIQRAREVDNDIEGAEQALQKANQYRP